MTSPLSPDPVALSVLASNGIRGQVSWSDASLNNAAGFLATSFKQQASSNKQQAIIIIGPQAKGTSREPRNLWLYLYSLHQPQPPSKGIGFSGICQENNFLLSTEKELTAWAIHDNVGFINQPKGHNEIFYLIKI